MLLTKEHISIYHDQNAGILKLVFYILAFVTALGYSIDTFLTLKNNELFSAYLNIFQVCITLASIALVLLSILKVKQASILFIYSQLLVETCAIFYYVASDDLEEKRYVIEFVLHLVYMIMIAYLASPKHSLYFGIVPLIVCIILNSLYLSDPRFSFMPIYLTILGGSPIGYYYIIKNMYSSFSSNYLSNLEIQKQAKNIEQQNKEIKSLNKFQKDLVAMIVHDLKNPLNIILSKTENSIARRSGKRMMNLIQNILDVEKYSETKILLNREVFSIAGELQLIIDDMSVLASEKNITLQYYGEDFHVYADKQIVNRILENLLTNALKYSEKNSQVDFKVSEYFESKLKIEVINYGRHIPEDKLERIFDKYSQINLDKSIKRLGSGLGLAFCKIALNAHGQEISAKNIAGGISIEFTLDKNSTISTKQIYHATENLKLSAFEKSSLLESLQKFKTFPIDNASEILSVVDQIELESDNISKWKLKLRTAVFSSNEELYHKLISLIGE